MPKSHLFQGDAKAGRAPLYTLLKIREGVNDGAQRDCFRDDRQNRKQQDIALLVVLGVMFTNS